MMQRFDCAFAPEIKAAVDGDMTFTGYGAVFGNVDSYGDVIQAGAFSESLRKSKTSGQWPAMLSQHGGFMGSADDMMPIGVWTDMAEDGTGLWVEGKFAPTQRGQEAYALLKMTPRPALNGLSIGFRAQEFEIHTKPGKPARTLKKIDLLEVSLVTMPANPRARVRSVKSAEEISTIREFEDFLRDAGFSNSAAKAIASGGFKAKAEPRDEDEAAELVSLLKQRGAVLSTLIHR